MPNHSPKRAFGSTDKARRKSANLDLSTARKMIPLVRRIVSDIRSLQGNLSRLQPEHERLERQRHDLVWLERQRRYQVQDQLTQTKRELAAALAELKALGVQMASREEGRVEFPTRINGRQAAFSWQSDEPDIAFWHYSGEEIRRPIPEDWSESPSNRPANW